MSDWPDWSKFYEAMEGRSTRPLFDEAISLFDAAGEAGVAVDLGCGDGAETVALLRRGWSVVAMDSEAQAIDLLRAAVPVGLERQLTAAVSRLEDFEIPPCDFAYAGASLPFCSPDGFESMWARLRAALRPGGRLAVNLFGPNDTWAVNPDMTFHSRAEVDRLLAGLEIEALRENETDGVAVSGPKHWHLFEIIARQPQA